MKKYRTSKHRKGVDHVGISRWTINGSEEWKELSSAAKILYFHIKGRFNGINNGNIELPYNAMSGVRGCSTSDTYSRAAKELESRGWIKRLKIGGLFRYKKLYKLTFRHENYAQPK